MIKKVRAFGLLLGFFLGMLFAFTLPADAQQTLGGITGSVADKTGSVLPETSVTIVGDQTKLTRTLKTNAKGEYFSLGVPPGTYKFSLIKDGKVIDFTVFKPQSTN